MIIYKSAAALNSYLEQEKSAGKSIGFVPTMGALHMGHLSLIYSCKQHNDITVASVFINPTQFNNPEDFKKYPVTVADDINKLEAGGCNVLFLPAADEIYPPGFSPGHYELGYLETILEGKYRPGHFQGVCQVVDRLLDIIRPTNLYLGQKDFQQCMVIKKLAAIKKATVTVNILPTLREKDGLAMSSRNLRLDKQERQQATKIYETMQMIRKDIRTGNLQQIKNAASRLLEENKFKVDYVEIADPATLELKNDWNGSDQLVILVAAYLNEVRLIDNLLIP